MFLRDENAPANLLSGSRFSKRLSQSTRPTKIRERLEILGVMKELHAKVEPILSVLNLGSEGIRYFAAASPECARLTCAAGPMKIIQVHLVAFIAHQYYRLHDNLVDVLLTSVKTFENATLREYRTGCFPTSASGMNMRRRVCWTISMHRSSRFYGRFGKPSPTIC